MRDKLLVLRLAVMVACFSLPAFSQPEAAAPAAPEKAMAEDVPWVWGEVTSVDAATGVISVRYIDSKEEVEKDLSLCVDSQTKFSNITGIADIKQGSFVSAEYVIQDGKNVIKEVTVEDNLEGYTEETAPSPEVAP